MQTSVEIGVEAQKAAGVRALEDASAARFGQAREEAQSAPGASIRAPARLLNAVIQGLGVSHRALGDRATLDDVVDTDRAELATQR